MDIAEALNDFYVNVGPSLSRNLDDPANNYDKPKIDDIFKLNQVDDFEIKQIINSLSNISLSPNGISNTFLNEHIDIVTPILTK